MGARPFFAIALAILLGSLAGPAWCQTTTANAARGLKLDPDASSEPDPLTPPEVKKPAPAAPGASPASNEANPTESVDPVVALVRQRLAGGPTSKRAADRDDHEGLQGFYAEHAGKPIWTGKDGLTARARQAIGEIRKADGWGLKASAFELPILPEGQATTEALAEAEIKLGLAVLEYGRHASGGRLDPHSISRIIDQKPTIYDPKTLMRAVATSSAVDAYLRDLHPKHPQFQSLRQALLAALGSEPGGTLFPNVKIPAASRLEPGQEHDHVVLLRQRLTVPGEEGAERVYDAPLVEAVKAYQSQRGLEPTGNLDTATRNALNGSGRPPAAADNVQRLIVNMERWRWMPRDLGSFYVWDSVPEQTTTVFKDGKPVLTEKIVVGKLSTPTPVFTADMLLVIFHPSWGVPPGMKVHELWPQLKETSGGWFFSTKPSASSVLKGHDLLVSRGGQPVDPDSVDWANVDIRSFNFMQPPGPKNLLGIVKFRFPNKHNVYMHDTPERHLFGGSSRVFSHGCMRVQNPVRLAEVLLAHDKGWSSDKVKEYVRRGGEIRLTTPIPVHVTYFTAVADDAGKIHYRPDIYGLDGRIASALEGRAVHLVAASAGAREPPAKRDRAARPKTRDSRNAPPPFNPFSGTARY